MGTGAESDSFTGFWEPIPHTRSPYPALIRGGRVLNITTS